MSQSLPQRPRRVCTARTQGERLLHVEHVPARDGPPGRTGRTRSRPAVLSALLAAGHASARGRTRRAASTSPRRARHVVIATGTASGKSLGYLLPVLTAASRGRGHAGARGATALYLAPTKALAADQLARHRGAGGARGAGGDLRRRHPARRAALDPRPRQRRAHQPRPAAPLAAARARALVALPAARCATSWSTSATSTAGCSARTCARCCAGCAGCAARYGADPDLRARLGDGRRPRDARRAADRDAGHRGHRRRLAPRRDDLRAVGAAAHRTGETAHRSARRRPRPPSCSPTWCSTGCRRVAFARSRGRGRGAGRAPPAGRSSEVDPALAERVAAYRGGYLPEERRALERALRDGSAARARRDQRPRARHRRQRARRRACWPAGPARARQPVAAGRAGRPLGRGRRSAVLVARDDPLDTYLVHHPEAMFGAAGRGHRARPRTTRTCSRRTSAAAAAELPLTRGRPADVRPDARAAARRARRERASCGAGPGVVLGPRRTAPADHISLRGGERRRGRRRGRAPAACSAPSTRPSSHAQVHTGAVHVHQGETWVVDRARPRGPGRARRARRPGVVDPRAVGEPSSTSSAASARERRAPGRVSFGDGAR